MPSVVLDLRILECGNEPTSAETNQPMRTLQSFVLVTRAGEHMSCVIGLLCLECRELDTLKTASEGNGASRRTKLFRHLFTGKERDTESGLDDGSPIGRNVSLRVYAPGGKDPFRAV